MHYQCRETRLISMIEAYKRDILPQNKDTVYLCTILNQLLHLFWKLCQIKLIYKRRFSHYCNLYGKFVNEQLNTVWYPDYVQ